METLQEYLESPKKPTPQPKKLSIDESIDNMIGSPNTLLKQLSNIDRMNEREVYDIIRKNYDLIMNNIYNTNSSSNCLSLFTNNKFLMIFTQVLQPANLTGIITINKVIYDYLHSNLEIDNYKKDLLFDLARVNNRPFLNSLYAIGLNDDMAVNLCMNKYSTDDEILGTKRLNHIIQTYDTKFMTEQMIVYIYERLFKRITPLFMGIMFDNDIAEYNALSEDAKEISGRESLAVLTLLENMPLVSIREVLSTYSKQYSNMYQYCINANIDTRTICRFSLKSISITDYPRIINSIDVLDKEGVYVY